MSIGFGIPTVILNTVRGFEVREIVSYVDDTIECKTENEFYTVINELVTDSAKYKAELAKAEEVRKKYFANSKAFNTSEFIRNYILRQAKP